MGFHRHFPLEHTSSNIYKNIKSFQLEIFFYHANGFIPKWPQLSSCYNHSLSHIFMFDSIFIGCPLSASWTILETPSKLQMKPWLHAQYFLLKLATSWFLMCRVTESFQSSKALQRSPSASSRIVFKSKLSICPSCPSAHLKKTPLFAFSFLQYNWRLLPFAEINGKYKICPNLIFLLSWSWRCCSMLEW